jgi:serpin B
MVRSASVLVLSLLALAGCGSAVHGSHPPPALPSRPAQPAPTPRPSSARDAAALRAGDAVFAGRMLAQLARNQPTVALSPLSISQALGMAYQGARGRTAAQIATALSFTLPAGRLASAWGALDRSLAAANGPGATLNVADALYGQHGMAFHAPFLSALSSDYGAPLRTADFMQAPATARAAINAWVSDETHGKIPQLLGTGDVNQQTRLVLVNAVYLNAKWASPFEHGATAAAPFHAPGGAVRVPFMNQMSVFPYARRSGYAALELPYRGGRLAFDVLLPDPGRLGSLLRRLAHGGPLGLLTGLRATSVSVALPKFQLDTRFELADPLSALGMPIAFEQGAADLSGIAGPAGDLYIQAVVHEAYVRVDEAGTEAAGATGVTIAPTAIMRPQVAFDADRPFVFLVRDRRTGAVLFLGLVSRP